jgi:hypothetical protein
VVARDEPTVGGRGWHDVEVPTAGDCDFGDAAVSDDYVHLCNY